MDKARKKSITQDLYSQIDRKLLRILRSVDKQVTKKLKTGKIVTRPSSTNGLWCCVLLPILLTVYTTLYKVSELYALLAYISVGLMAYCFLFIVFVSVSCLILKENIYGGCAASSLTAALLLYGVQGQGLIFSLVVSTAAVFAFSTLLRAALTKYPKTFTIGEAMVVTQSIVLFTIMAICKIIFDMGDNQDDEMKFLEIVIFTVLSSVGIIVTALYFLDESQRNLQTFAYIVSVALTYALTFLHAKAGLDCIVKLSAYVLLDKDRVKLFLFWLFLFIVSVLLILFRTKVNVKADTVTRKSFHILASLVFLSGISSDIRLMTLAAAVGFGLLIVVEAVRKSGIEPVSPALQAAFDVYSDEKDVGSFAMTPIYLYIGLACPLILVPQHPGYELELLSGVLSIGIGDTAASWFGSKYGRSKWLGGNKTLEGTAFNIIAQVAVMYALQYFSLFQVKNVLFRVAVTATISGLVEAKTDQVDNLILPLITMIAFQPTFFMA